MEEFTKIEANDVEIEQEEIEQEGLILNTTISNINLDEEPHEEPHEKEEEGEEGEKEEEGEEGEEILSDGETEYEEEQEDEEEVTKTDDIAYVIIRNNSIYGYTSSEDDAKRFIRDIARKMINKENTNENGVIDTSNRYYTEDNGNSIEIYKRAKFLVISYDEYLYSVYYLQINLFKY